MNIWSLPAAGTHLHVSAAFMQMFQLCKEIGLDADRTSSAQMTPQGCSLVPFSPLSWMENCMNCCGILPSPPVLQPQAFFDPQPNLWWEHSCPHHQEMSPSQEGEEHHCFGHGCVSGHGSTSKNSSWGPPLTIQPGTALLKDALLY